MGEQITTNELLEMKEQLRELKQQVEMCTSFHENRLNESITENTSYFKHQMRKYERSILCLAAICIIGLGELIFGEENIFMKIIIILNCFSLGFYLWEWLLFRNQFNLHKLAALDLLSAQEKIESYKLYQEKKKRLRRPIVILLMPLVLYVIIKSEGFGGGQTAEGMMHNIGVCVLIFLVCFFIAKKQYKKEKTTISTLLADIQELKEMEKKA